MSRINTNYSYARNGNYLMLSYNSIFRKEIWHVSAVDLKIKSDDIYTVGDDSGVTSLNYTLCTNIAATTIEEFIDKLINLINTSTSVLDISLGNLNNIGTEHKFGINETIGQTTEYIWPLGGLYSFLTIADYVRIKAGGNINDSSTGSGARSIKVIGLDENFTELEETIETNGVDVSSSTLNKFIRVNRAYVVDVGTYGGNNTGDITIETNGGVIISFIKEVKGQTQMGIYTVPVNKTAYITRISTIVTKLDVDIHMFQRESADNITEPFISKRLITEFHGETGSNTTDYNSYIKINEKSDLFFEAMSLTGTSGVAVTWDMYLVDN